MKMFAFIGIAVLAFLTAGCATTNSANDAMQDNSMHDNVVQDDSMMDDGSMQNDAMDDKDSMMDDGDSMAKDDSMSDDSMMDDGSMEKDDGSMMQDSYDAVLLAGTTTPYYEFDQAAYDQALVDGKIVYLEFYANWCPYCSADDPNIKSFFDAQQNSDFVGFRVNYKDSDTNNNEESLAKQFGITTQHTRVILKNSQEVYRKIGTFDSDSVLDTLA